MQLLVIVKHLLLLLFSRLYNVSTPSCVHLTIIVSSSSSCLCHSSLFPSIPLHDIIIIIIIIMLLLLLLMLSLVTILFFPVLLLNQRWSPPLRLQVSDCSTSLMVCDVASTAVFCSESIESFPCMAYLPYYVWCS